MNKQDLIKETKEKILNFKRDNLSVSQLVELDIIQDNIKILLSN